MEPLEIEPSPCGKTPPDQARPRSSIDDHVVHPRGEHDRLGLGASDWAATEGGEAKSGRYTSPGTNMEVENGPLEEHFPLQRGDVSLPC